MDQANQTNDSLVADLRGFGIIGIVSMLIILLTGTIVIGNIALPVGAMLVLLWTKLSHTPWSSIGYVKPKNLFITIIGGIIFGIIFKLIMKAIVMPLFNADPINRAYHFLAGNKPMLPFAIWAMLVAGFAEETIFRGYLFERLGKLLGNRRTAKIFIVLITSILFGFGHYFNMGWDGVIQATITGLVFGTIYSMSRSILFVMIVHAAFDLTALAIIYWNVEMDVAHWVFK